MSLLFIFLNLLCKKHFFSKKFGVNKKMLYICIVKCIKYGKIITPNIKTPSNGDMFIIRTSHNDGWIGRDTR